MTYQQQIAAYQAQQNRQLAEAFEDFGNVVQAEAARDRAEREEEKAEIAEKPAPSVYLREEEEREPEVSLIDLGFNAPIVNPKGRSIEPAGYRMPKASTGCQRRTRRGQVRIRRPNRFTKTFGVA